MEYELFITDLDQTNLTPAKKFYLEYSADKYGNLSLLYEPTIFVRLFTAFLKSNTLAIDLSFLLIQEKIEQTDIKNLAGDQSTQTASTINKQTNLTGTGYTAYGADSDEPYIKITGNTDNDQQNQSNALNFNMLKNMYLIYDIDFTDLFKRIDKQLLQLLQTLYAY